MNEATFKIILIGDSGSGKSCLLARFIRDYFAQDYSVTVGVDFATKTIPIDENYRVKLQIWDTAGQESFKSIVKTFYRNASAVVLVYDITRQQSFQSLGDLWLQEARQYAPSKTMLVLMGTHLDLVEKRQVKQEDAEKMMKLQSLDFRFETSSKTAENVAMAFEEIAKQLFLIMMKEGRRKSEEKQMPNGIPITSSLLNEQNKCC